MPNPQSLAVAKGRAGKLRYKYDSFLPSEDFHLKSTTEILASLFSENELKVTSAITPILADSLAAVSNELGLPSEYVQAYVYNSQDMQAYSIAGDDKTCILRISSALVNQLDELEISFVFGHELGHFLLSHQFSSMQHEMNSLEGIMQKRNQEISADRIGLAACGSLEPSIRAMIKLVSGLDSRHLRFNVGSFLSQLDNVSQGGMNNSSHPSFLIRARALLWVSMQGLSYYDQINEDALNDVDEKINRDISKYVNGPILNRIEEAKESYRFWLMVGRIIERNVFTKDDQEKIRMEYGTSKLESLKRFLSQSNAVIIKKWYKERITEAEKSLKQLIPESYENEVGIISMNLV